MARPKVLYKYRHFNERTIDLLCRDLVYFANPSTFNDPMDTQPRVEMDCDIRRMEQTIREMIQMRLLQEMKANASKIRYSGPKTVEHIQRLVESLAERRLEELQYYSSDPEAGDEMLAYRGLLERELEHELLLQYDRGVLSLAKRFDCPLMWSHYGDQHRGICIGYAVPSEVDAPEWAINLHEVNYGGSRCVKASAVAAMVLDNDPAARVCVDAAVLLQKAPDWQYEKEWRMLGKHGLLSPYPLEMSEIIFGMRCERPVMYTIVSALKGREKQVSFFQMQERFGTFELVVVDLDLDDLEASYPHCDNALFDLIEDLEGKSQT